MKRVILAMSRSRQEVGATIEQGTRELINHLIKLWQYPDSLDIAKWRKEVAEKLNQVDTFKGKHTLPSAQFILDNSWRIWRPKLPNMVQYIIDDYGQPTTDKGFNLMRDRIDEYFMWLARMLSNDGQVSYAQIYRTLEMLGF